MKNHLQNKFTRILKNENNYLTMYKGKENTAECMKEPNNYITKYNMVNNKVTVFKYNSNKNKSNSLDILSSSDILDMYNIFTIEELNNYIENNLTYGNKFLLLRILNCWIKNNYNILKNNSLFEKIIFKITLYFSIIIKKINNIKDLNNIIKEYIDYWIDKNNENSFELDIINDLLIYLKKKFNIN